MRTPKPLPSQAYLRERLSYNPRTGDLTWLNNPTVSYVVRGKKALAADNHGYRRGIIDGQSYFAHRVIWKWVYGTDPLDIDHINGKTSDNRITNLRSVTTLENHHNKRAHRSNTSGHVGIYSYGKGGKWVAIITYNYKTIRLGCFETKSEAAAARRKAQEQLPFTKRHGSLTHTKLISTRNI